MTGIEEIAVSEWADGLTGVTGDQIKIGLSAWDGDWPPSLPEFRKTCLGKMKNGFGLDYVPECYRQEKRPEHLLENDKDKARRKQSATSGIAAMREKLNVKRKPNSDGGLT